MRELDARPEVVARAGAATLTVLDRGVGDARELRYAVADVPFQTQELLLLTDFTQQTVTGAAPELAVPELSQWQLSPRGSELRLGVEAATRPATEPDSPAEQAAEREVLLAVTTAEADDSIRTADVRTGVPFAARERSQANGLLSSVGLSAPERASNSAKATLENAIRHLMSVQPIFPAEPVGRGASWVVESPALAASMRQRTTYRVSSLSDDEVVLDVAVEVEPTRTTLQLPDAPPHEAEGAGATLRVSAAETASRGVLVVRPNAPLPLSGHVSWTNRVVYVGENSGGSSSIVQDATTMVHFGAPGNPPAESAD